MELKLLKQFEYMLLFFSTLNMNFIYFLITLNLSVLKFLYNDGYMYINELKNRYI